MLDSGVSSYQPCMPSARLLVLVAVLLAAARPAIGAEPDQCLSAEQQRAAIASQKAVPVARVLHAAKTRQDGEVLRVQLCERNELVYVLTVLARDGKVHRVTVDAATGRPLDGR
jgi:uncharacterized membrane protein YkoI